MALTFKVPQKIISEFASTNKNVLGFYNRNGILIKKLILKRTRANDGYKEVKIPPTLGWYPSKSSSFSFKGDYDADYLLDLLPIDWNPAIWINPWNKLYTIRVPKDRKDEVFKRLYWKKFWFNTKKYWWEPQYRHPVVKEANHARRSKDARKRIWG